MDRNLAWQLLHEPQTEAAVLANIALEYPEFAEAIAQHPACYDELRAWAAAQSDTSSPVSVPAEDEAGSSPRGGSAVGSAQPRSRRAMLAVVVAVVAVGIVIGIAAVSLVKSQRAVADARDAFTVALADYYDLESQLENEQAALSGAVRAAEEAGLEGSSIDSAKAAATPVVNESPTFEIVGDGWNDPAIIRQVTDELNEAIESIRARLVELVALRAQLDTNTSVALRGAAADALATALEEAEHAFSSSAGRVSDEAPRESLQRSIESARADLSDVSVSPDRLQQQAGSLAEGVAAVKAVMLPRWDDISGVWCPVDRSWGGCQELDLSRSYQSGYPPRPGVSASPGPNSGDGVHGCFLGALWPDDTLSQGSNANLLFCPAGVVSNNFLATVPEAVEYDRIYAFQSMDIRPWYRVGDFEAATGSPLP